MTIENAPMRHLALNSAWKKAGSQYTCVPLLPTALAAIR
jgi:hypothetical protein